MCLDVSFIYKNQENMKKSTETPTNNEINMMNSETVINRLCGGSLINYQPVFDPKGEIIYVVWSDKVRMYSIETGECIKDLDDNKDGNIVGLQINPESQKSLIACTKNGTIINWKLDSYLISSKLKLSLSPTFTVTRFIATSIDGELHGIVSYKDERNRFQLVIVELKKGKIVQQYQIPFASENKGRELKVKLSDGGSSFFAAAQSNTLYVVDKKSNNFIAHENPSVINVVACHPEESTIATGDTTGKIKLWRDLFSQHPTKSELHWHHQIVLCLAFSQSGTVLYSGGAECVLVKWNIKDKMIHKDFLPRFPGCIKQISVDPKYDKLTISTADNAIQVINSSFVQFKSIQDFTQTSQYDLGTAVPFPVGMRLNPRNNQLVTNGRIGHLQFFSTSNMKLLFNVDITMRNEIPRTKNVNIYSTQVTRAAFSTVWMATVEGWNDKINSPDSRLKFWRFLADMQTYSLHTQIEQAHEKEITCVEFSSREKSNSLICATAARDHCIKIWSLEKADDFKAAKKIWLCIDQLSFKDLPIRHLCFSQDSSLIGAGFGNVLCIWDSVTFKLKCALSSPASIDGSTNRVLLTLPLAKKSSKISKEIVANTLEKRRKIIDLMKSVIDGTAGESLVKNMTVDKKRRFFEQKEVKSEKAKNLSKGEKEEIFKRVISIPDLSFNQKIEIFHKLNIYYKLSDHVEKEVTDFIARTSLEGNQLYKSLQSNIIHIRSHEKYKVQWRFRSWNLHNNKRNRKMVTVRKLLKHKLKKDVLEKIKAKEEETEGLLPIKNLNHITNVVFCTEEFSHLVIVTTPDRLLVWNLLTLKVQGSFKLHTKFITLDPITNLVAVFTKYNELFVFHPSPAITIHHQKNIPEIFGAVWVPREVPKAQSVNVNWQAASQLLFLNDHQEICSFKLPGDDDYGNAAPFMEMSNGFTSNTPFAAMIAQKITDETTGDSNGASKRIAISGSAGAVKDIINLSSHAMPPMRLLSKDFIGSMLLTEKKTKPQRSESAEIADAMVISDDENETTPLDEKILRRRAIEKEEKAMREKSAKKKEAVNNIESKIKNLKLDYVESFDL